MPRYTENSLSSKTEDQLIEIGNKKFGIDLMGKKKDEMVAAIMEISSNDVPPTEQKKYRLTIHEGAGSDEKDAVPVSVNGYARLIPREKECVVPEEVIEVLKNAVQTVFERNKEGEIVSRPVRRFNFTYDPA